MEIIIGKTAGFCYGVERAVNEAKKEINNNKEVYCLGEIVHNKNVVKNLEEQGIKFIENIEEAKGRTIIRAHGVSKEIYKKAEELNIELKDLTCPSVLKIHKIAEKYSLHNYYIILTGKKNHPEVIGIESFCGDKFKIISNKNELENILPELKNEENILLISQTTYNSTNFDEIAQILTEKIKSNLVIKKTICMSTEIRQNETRDIAKEADLMIIIGDKKSSNTNKLYDISCKYCNNVLFIENAEDIEIAKIKNIKKIGIMAGASTPKEDIQNVIYRVGFENNKKDEKGIEKK